MPRDSLSVTRLATTAAMTAIAVLAAIAHDWAGAGTAIGWVAFNLAVSWLSADRFRARLDLEPYRIDPLPGDVEDATPEPRRQGRIMLAVVLAGEIAVVLVAGVILRAPALVSVVCIVGVVPLALTVAGVVARRPGAR